MIAIIARRRELVLVSEWRLGDASGQMLLRQSWEKSALGIRDRQREMLKKGGELWRGISVARVCIINNPDQ